MSQQQRRQPTPEELTFLERLRRSNAGSGLINAFSHIGGRIGAAADLRTMPQRAAQIGQGMWDAAGLGWVPNDVAQGVAFGARPANAAVPKPVAPQAFAQPSQPRVQSNVAPGGGYNPFQGFTTVSGGEPGASRDGGARRHAGRDFAGMKVGHTVFAPPSGATLLESGTRSKDGHFGRWRLGDGTTMSVAHLATRPDAKVVLPGQPLAFLGNSGNASNRGTDRAVAHVRTWGPDGREVDPARAFSASSSAEGTQLGAVRGAMAATGFGNGPPAPNMAGYRAADQMYQQAGQNAMQPFSATYTPTPLPEMPKPQAMVAPDMSKGDAAFAATQPKNPFGDTPEAQEKGQLKLRRATWFAGIGQALASFRDGEGLGSLFARMGGGALQGAALGDAKVQAKIDQFDENMAQFNRALANREDGKATTLANVMNQNIQQTNRYTEQKWVHEVSQIQASQPRMENGVLITKDKQADGSIRETHTPLDPTRTTQSIMARAQNAVGAVNEQNQASMLGWQHDQAVARAALPYAMADAGQQGQYGERNQIMQMGLYDAGNALVETGRWREIAGKLSPDLVSGPDSIPVGAAAAAGVILNSKTGQPMQPPTAQQLATMNAFTVSALVPALVNAGKAHWLVGGTVENFDPKTGQRVNRRQVAPQSEVQGAVQAFRARDRSSTVTRNAKGQTSVSERYDGQ